jgi:hypothetical protein
MEKLKTYAWYSAIGSNPIEIKVFATSPEEARREVLQILDKIAQYKPAHDELNNQEISWQQRRKLRDELLSKVHADFFEGCYAAGAFDYTADTLLGSYQEGPTLIDFIRKTEPTCCGPVRMVSFRSCLDG